VCGRSEEGLTFIDNNVLVGKTGTGAMWGERPQTAGACASPASECTQASADGPVRLTRLWRLTCSGAVSPLSRAGATHKVGRLGSCACARYVRDRWLLKEAHNNRGVQCSVVAHTRRRAFLRRSDG
jgi:hypothetical protein